MIGLFAAMTMEVSGLRRRLALTESVREQECTIDSGRYEGLDVLLVRSGMGKARAQAAADAVLPRYPLSAVLSLGFAGALVPSLAVGDIVLCSAVRCGGTEVEGNGDALACDSKLLSLAASLPSNGLTVSRGVGVTSETFVSSPDAKRALAVTAEATVVDMESCWIARAASDAGVPFLSVRVISDALTTRLPPLERAIGADGGWRWGVIAGHCLTRPQHLVALVSLWRATRRARRSLTAYAESLLAAIAAQRAEGGSHIHRARERATGRVD